SVTARFTLFNRQGQPPATVERARVNAMPMRRTRGNALQYSKDVFIPAPRTRTLVIPPALSTQGWVTLLQSVANPIQHSQSVQRFVTETDPLLDVLLGHFAAEAFHAQTLLAKLSFNDW